MATSIDQKNFVKTALRLPPELHAAVHESAQKNGRSYNAELVERVQRSFEVDEGDRQAEMLLEMRRTQLLLELNSSRQELAQLYAEGKDLQRQLEDAQDVQAIDTLDKAIDEIFARKKEVDRRSSEVLNRLAELDAIRSASQPKN